MGRIKEGDVVKSPCCENHTAQVIVVITDEEDDMCGGVAWVGCNNPDCQEGAGHWRGVSLICTNEIELERDEKVIENAQ